MPTTKYSRHEIADFSGQRLHDDDYLFENLPSDPSTVNAQRAGELVHPALPRTVLFVLY
jgi:hypothetical protein